MRHDHFAYQQATRVAGIGILLQALMALGVFLFGRIGQDTTLVFGAVSIAIGILPWVALTVVFHQHRLERLEVLENDEIAALRGDARSVFEGDREQGTAAASRLRLMHQWLMPIVSVAYATLLGLAAWWSLSWMAQLDDTAGNATTFRIGSALGWQVATCAGLSLIAFIFSRFVAGMSTQGAWQNLRGGAGIMVGNALVLLAIAVGVVFQVFQKAGVLEGVARGIGIFMILVGSETALNLVLNLYRPRRPGETPRPAFDSKVLGLLAAPDSLVRTINEAVNYQFGFDITSSWGYQLMLRSVAWLAGLAAVVLVLLSTIVVVQPGEQAVRLRGGRVVGEPVQGALMWKLPWPVETVERFSASRIRSLVVGPKPFDTSSVNFWPVDNAAATTDRQPFIVLASSLAAQASADLGSGSFASQVASPPASSGLALPGSGGVPASQPVGTEGPADDALAGRVSSRFALVDADVLVNYRIKADGLLDFLSFANDTRTRRSPLDMRERVLKAVAMRETSQFLSTQTIDQVLSPQGDSIVRQLRERIQAAYDRLDSGVEVVSVLIPTLRPPAGDAAGMFEELSIDTQNARQLVQEAQRLASTSMAMMVGSVDTADRAAAAINRLRQLERELGRDAPAVLEQRALVESILLESRAAAASVISAARAKRWKLLMDARGNAAKVLGQAPAFRAAPDLYRERAIMMVLGKELAKARNKYILGVDAARAGFDMEMVQPESGLNLADYLDKTKEEGK
jgi:regulator of protease activity HflC (stomatin/prohibitin superfamily)